MHARGFLGPEVTPQYWVTHYNRWIPFNPETLKRLLDEYCVIAGVDIRLFHPRRSTPMPMPTGHKVSGRDHQQYRGSALHPRQGVHRCDR